MKRVMVFGIAAFGLLIASQSESFGQQKKPATAGGKTSPATPQQYGLLMNYRELVGTVESVDRDSVVVRITYDHPVQQPTKNNNTNVRPQNNRGRTNPNQALMAQLRKAQQAAANTKMVHDFLDFDLPFTDDYKIRKMNATSSGGFGGGLYDEKGEFKMPTAPAAAPKTTPNTSGLPGFPGKLSDLTTGAQVKVTLAAPRKTAPVPRKDENGVLFTPPNSGHPRVSMIVVLTEGGGPAATPSKKK